MIYISFPDVIICFCDRSLTTILDNQGEFTPLNFDI